MNYKQSAVLPTEFRLAVACCRWTFAGGSADPVLAAVREVDWTLFLTTARRHRIEGLAWHCLSGLDIALPPAIARQLAERARAIANHGLHAAAESSRLLQAFEQAGIALLFIKGLTVGELAYPNPFVKMSWDIDVLVAPESIFSAATLLESMGYVRVLPEGEIDQRQFEAWHRRRKESVWLQQDQKLHLELHSRLPDSPSLISEVGIDSPRQLVEVTPGAVLPTLAGDELFAYLSVHGALSGWHRLKWLSDFAALLDGANEAEIERLYRSSQTLGAGRGAGQALLLAGRLFATPIGKSLEQRLAADRITRWLTRIALRQMTSHPHLEEPTSRRFGTVMIHFSHLLLAPGWRTVWSEVGRKSGEALRNLALARSGKAG